MPCASERRAGVPAEIQELLAAEYARRGVVATASQIATVAGIVHTEQRPFGRARSAIDAIRALRSLGGDVVRVVKTGPDPTPEWAVPPERAAYVVRRTRRHAYTAVRLDPDAELWLARVWVASAEPLGQHTTVDVWLSREEPDAAPDDALVAHIGVRRVGTVPGDDVAAFDQALRAAALFDEDPCLRSMLTRPPGQSVHLLEIPLPLPPATETPAG
jgi:hypothetical protein